jgi:outer membrane protein assembly factor BamD (BamD/ComL family)
MKISKQLLLILALCTTSFIPAEAQENEIESEGITLAELAKKTPGGLTLFERATLDELYERGTQEADSGDLRRADRTFKSFIKRAPHHPNTVTAQQRRADMYLARGKLSKARKAYEDLFIKYGAQTDYDAALKSLIELAKQQENERSFKWIRGGFTRPETCIPTLELIVKYGPTTALAPAAQYRIGLMHQQNNDYADAALAYDVVLFRYPDSPVTEQAAFAKAECLRKISLIQKNNETAREEASVAARVFINMFPQSAQTEIMKTWLIELTELRALDIYNKALFYETKAFKPDAAKLYYNIVIDQFKETQWAAEASIRLQAMTKEEPSDA